MKKSLFISAIFIFLSLPAFGSDTQVTILADDAYRPFSFEENGEAKGIYIDVLRTAFSRMNGFEVKIKPVPWKRGKKMMEVGEGFGLTPAFFHGHDWPYLYPYSLPFYTETIMAVCAEEFLESPRPVWPDDYKGLKIGNVAGFDGWGGDAFRTLVKEGKIGYEETKGSKEVILKQGLMRTDCIMMEEKAFDYQFNRLKKKGIYDEGGKHARLKKGAVIGKDPVYIGYSRTAREMGKYPFQFEFMQALDSVLYKMVKSGEIEKIMSAYEN